LRLTQQFVSQGDIEHLGWFALGCAA
jgi:hypothetical protein